MKLPDFLILIKPRSVGRTALGGAGISELKLVAAAALSFLMFTLVPLVHAQSEGTRYDDPENLFSVEVPEGWIVRHDILSDSRERVAFVKDDRSWYKSGVVIVVEKVGKDLEQYFRWVTRAYSTVAAGNELAYSYSAISTTPTTISGFPAKLLKFGFSHDPGSGTMDAAGYSEQAFVVSDNIAYNILFIADATVYDLHYPGFLQILNSIKLTPENAELTGPDMAIVSIAVIGVPTVASGYFWRHRKSDNSSRTYLAMGSTMAVTYAFVAAIIAQSLHMVEHVAQVYQHTLLGFAAPHSHGILWFLDLEWNHWIFNTAYLILIAVIFYRCKFYRIGNITGAYRLVFALFGVGLAVQGYHVVEHSVRMVQFFQNGCTPCPGILGLFFDGVYLHALLNTVVYIGPFIAFFSLGFYSVLLNALKSAWT